MAHPAVPQASGSPAAGRATRPTTPTTCPAWDLPVVLVSVHAVLSGATLLSTRGMRAIAAEAAGRMADISAGASLDGSAETMIPGWLHQGFTQGPRPLVARAAAGSLY
jgi:hypothetical protein